MDYHFQLSWRILSGSKNDTHSWLYILLIHYGDKL